LNLDIAAHLQGYAESAWLVRAAPTPSPGTTTQTGKQACAIRGTTHQCKVFTTLTKELDL
jgi:hypothetical protein